MPRHDDGVACASSDCYRLSEEVRVLLGDCLSMGPHPNKPQAEGRLGWLSLLAYLVAVSSVTCATFWTWRVMKRMGIHSRLLADVRLVLTGLALVLLTLLWMRREKMPKKRIGMGLRQFPIGMALGVSILALTALTGYLYIRMSRQPGDPMIALVAPTRHMNPLSFVEQAFCHWLVVAGSEELVYRGYIQNKLLDLLGGRTGWYRRIGAVSLSSLIFGLSHIPSFLVTHGPFVEVIATYVAYTMIGGFLLGLVYDLTGNLWLPVAIHAFSNHPLPYLVGSARLGVLFEFPPALTLVCAYRWLMRRHQAPEN